MYCLYCAVHISSVMCPATQLQQVILEGLRGRQVGQRQHQEEEIRRALVGQCWRKMHVSDTPLTSYCSRKAVKQLATRGPTHLHTHADSRHSQPHVAVQAVGVKRAGVCLYRNLSPCCDAKAGVQRSQQLLQQRQGEEGGGACGRGRRTLVGLDKGLRPQQPRIQTAHGGLGVPGMCRQGAENCLPRIPYLRQRRWSAAGRC